MGKKQRGTGVFDAPAHYYPTDAMPLAELAHWIAFSRVTGIGPVRFRLLLNAFHGDATVAWKASEKELALAGLEAKVIASFLRQRATIAPERELERLEKLKIHIITWMDASYPPLLRKIDYAPPVLYMCGSMNEDDRRYALAIVGTRRMSVYGRQVTERFATELARGKITIISGLALGVDTVAHTAALDAGGRTIAVIASGLDHIYPQVNYSLAQRIIESGQGALITPFPLGVKPEKGNFPARNHIISALALGVLVTEAPPQSGALITAGSALDQGREVFAVPGGIFSPGGAGVNKLIQEGAHPVTSVNDILEQLNLFMVPAQVEAQAVLPENAEEDALLHHISHEPQHIDEITRNAGLPIHVVASTLTMMELKGMVRQVGGMQYVLAR